MPAAPIIFGREFFEVDPRSTALIVIDMQNAFVAEGARYSSTIYRWQEVTFRITEHFPSATLWSQSGPC
jgi:hypothetical protein